MDKMQMQSIDLTAQNVDKIAALFPNCVTEAADENGRLRRAINFDMLRQMLSGEVIEFHMGRQEGCHRRSQHAHTPDAASLSGRKRGLG